MPNQNRTGVMANFQDSSTPKTCAWSKTRETFGMEISLSGIGGTHNLAVASQAPSYCQAVRAAQAPQYREFLLHLMSVLSLPHLKDRSRRSGSHLATQIGKEHSIPSPNYFQSNCKVSQTPPRNDGKSYDRNEVYNLVQLADKPRTSCCVALNNLLLCF